MVAPSEANTSSALLTEGLISQKTVVPEESTANTRMDSYSSMGMEYTPWVGQKVRVKDDIAA